DPKWPSAEDPPCFWPPGRICAWGKCVCQPTYTHTSCWQSRLRPNPRFYPAAAPEPTKPQGKCVCQPTNGRPPRTVCWQPDQGSQPRHQLDSQPHDRVFPRCNGATPSHGATKCSHLRSL